MPIGQPISHSTQSGLSDSPCCCLAIVCNDGLAGPGFSPPELLPYGVAVGVGSIATASRNFGALRRDMT